MTRNVEQLEAILVHFLDPDGPAKAGDSGRDEFHRDDSSEYVYVALELPARLGPDIDISLHKDVCQIRIQKHSGSFAGRQA